MKRIYLIIFALVFFHFADATNPVPNSSFETWASGNPTGWTTSNVSGIVTTVTQTSPGNSGSYAAKGQPAVYATDTVPPELVSSSFAATLAYNNFKFFYKSNLVSNDIIVASAFIYDSGSNLLAIGVDSISTNSASFTEKDITITYYQAGTPATAQIIFIIGNNGSSSTAPHPASYFIVDDVSLNLVAGVNEINADSKINVYPVPAHDWLTVKGQTDNSKSVNLILMDITGRVVMEKKSGTSSGNFIDEELNLHGITPGIYSLALVSDESVLTRKIVIQ